jgi:Rrf2 family protein
MALLASATDQPSLTKYQIADSEAISPAYAQQLLMSLRLAGLVVSHRGRLGGFSLGRDPDKITVSDILAAVEGEILPAPCRAATHCSRAADCPSRPVWEKAAALLEDLFGGITLADMVNGHRPV